jgi:hypothetical protein
MVQLLVLAATASAAPQSGTNDLTSAIGRATGRLQTACSDQVNPLSDGWAAAFARDLRRFEADVQTPSWVRDLSYRDMIGQVLWLEQRTRGCLNDSRSEPVSGLSQSTGFPSCVKHLAEQEIRAAAILQSWGDSEAATYVLGRVERWSRAPCRSPRGAPVQPPFPAKPKHPPTAASPTGCWCGSGREPPGSYGPFPSLDAAGFQVLVEFEVAGTEGCEVLEPSSFCPDACVPLGWASADRRPARSAVDWRVVQSPLANVLLVGAIATPTGDSFLNAVSQCTQGTAEWLGEWSPWDSRPGSLCVAAAARTYLHPQAWLVVNRG